MINLTDGQLSGYVESGYRVSWHPLTPAARQDWTCDAPRHAGLAPARWLTVIYRMAGDEFQVRQACYSCEDCKRVMERDVMEGK